VFWKEILSNVNESSMELETTRINEDMNMMDEDLANHEDFHLSAKNCIEYIGIGYM
jgi:hypothetical protein